MCSICNLYDGLYSMFSSMPEWFSISAAIWLGLGLVGFLVLMVVLVVKMIKT